jgi:type IV pilus assembly protein PilY1
MRRGGNDYFALDVTNRLAPVYKWKISGGSGDFADLGQSWSKMFRTKLRLSCTDSSCDDRDVLVFTGGYDTQFDDEDYLAAGTHEGAAIYIVDANTGAKLWSAGSSLGHSLELGEMTNSIPADPTIGDLNSDGLIDVLFAVDITGQVFRVDFSKSPTNASDIATGGMIFDLGDIDNDSSNDAANFRRFYNAPDVSLFGHRGEEPFFSIAVNSGYRSHPKNSDVTDRLFVLYERSVFAAPAEYELRDVSDLFDATSLAADRTNYPNGWFKSFSNGEKGLSPSVTFGGRLLFSTYLPQGTAASLCSGSTGGGRLYNLDILTGRTVLTNTDNQYIEFQDLNHGGIPPNPSIIYVPDDTDADGDGQPDNSRASEEVVCVGTECFADLFDGVSPIERTYWREN